MSAIGIQPLIIALMMLLWLLIARLPFDPYFNLAIFLGCLGVMFGWLGLQAEEIYKSQPFNPLNVGLDSATERHLSARVSF